MIIDSHVHLYPPSVYENPSQWATDRDERYWLSCVLPEKGPFLQGWASVDQLLKDMDAASIDKVVILGWYWENHKTCEENLNWQIEWVRAKPDRIIAFAPFNPKGGQKALEMLQLAFDVGFRGIGELNPPAQGYPYDDPLLGRAIELATQAQGLVSLHVTEPASHEYPSRVDTPYAALLSLAERHPSARFIYSHLGGLLPFHEFNRRAKKALANVWYDTAAVPLLYDRSIYRKLCDTIDSSRILFGSDYPLRSFPKRQAKPGFLDHLADLRQADLSDQELDAILGGNLENLLATS